jgi:hypothetical protein
VNPVLQRVVLNVRFAPKATELLRRREMTRWANMRHEVHRHDATRFAVAFYVVMEQQAPRRLL